MRPLYDLLIVGGGVNGAGTAYGFFDEDSYVNQRGARLSHLWHILARTRT